MRVLLSLILSMSAAAAFARTAEGVDFPEEITVNGQKLVLDGTALRTKRKFFKDWKVYVAGLYVPAKTKDGEALLKGPEAKVLDLVFLRSIDKKTLSEAWKEHFDTNCMAACEEAKKEYPKFAALVPDVKDKTRMRMIFEKDGVALETGELKGKVPGEPFRNAMLGFYVGEKPLTEEIKRGLLGL